MTGAHRTRLFIKGDAPVLREKDILTPETADTPAKRIYLSVQMMYLEKNTGPHKDNYFTLVKDIVEAAPSTLPYVEKINNQILREELYKALREVNPNLTKYLQVHDTLDNSL